MLEATSESGGSVWVAVRLRESEKIRCFSEKNYIVFLFFRPLQTFVYEIVMEVIK